MQAFLHDEQLPDSYLALVAERFAPLAVDIATYQKKLGRPLLIGINGSQGSGKSTLAALLRVLLSNEHGRAVLDLSIDDFYLTRDERQALAKQVHPLLATRGVPGTHDTGLLLQTLESLLAGAAGVAIPRFNKALDDRVPEGKWDQSESALDVIILEGWCLGAPAESSASLTQPINALEEHEDSEGVWRAYVNRCISDAYQAVYDKVDLWVMLQAPSFDSVYRWRLEQEQKLAARLRETGESDKRVMTEAQIARFIQHYQRLTEQSLRALPETVNYLFCLDEQRQIVEASQPRKVSW